MWNRRAGVAVADQAGPERHHLHVAARTGALIRRICGKRSRPAPARAPAPARGPRACSRTRASRGTRRGVSVVGLAALRAGRSSRRASADRPAAPRSSAKAGFGGALSATAADSAERTESASGSSTWRAGARRVRGRPSSATQRAAAASRQPRAGVGRGSAAAHAASRCLDDDATMRRPASTGDGRRVAPALVLRPCLPSGRGRRRTTRCGMPISSQSANIAPGRSPRSSSSTSMPAACELVVQRVGGRPAPSAERS